MQLGETTPPLLLHSIALFWGFKLVLALSFLAICYSQSTDAARYYCNMIDDVYPDDLANYNTEITAFSSSHATPEDINVCFVIFLCTSMSSLQIFGTIRCSTIFQVSFTATGSTFSVQLCPTLGKFWVHQSSRRCLVAMSLFTHHTKSCPYSIRFGKYSPQESALKDSPNW